MTTKSNHPKKIKVGPYNYTVKEFPKGETTNHGACVYIHQEIFINRNQSAERAADTLLHEVLHAIWDAAGLDQVPNLHEEVVVRAFATHLTDILTINPHLTEFIVNPKKTWVPRYEKDSLTEAADVS
jgi:hypothetical protein